MVSISHLTLLFCCSVVKIKYLPKANYMKNFLILRHLTEILLFLFVLGLEFHMAVWKDFPLDDSSPLCGMSILPKQINLHLQNYVNDNLHFYMQRANTPFYGTRNFCISLFLGILLLDVVYRAISRL